MVRSPMTGHAKMVSVLVTGGAGFIGSNFVRYALAEHAHWHVTTLDKLTYAGRVENLRGVMDHPRHTFVRGDVADAKVAAPLVKEADIIVHFAAETHVDRSLHSAGEFITTDVYGTFVLLEAARSSPQLRRFIQISTDEVYGSVPEGASHETDELRPRNPYAASKAGADRLAYSYWATYAVPVIITRASNTYGSHSFQKKSFRSSSPTRSTTCRCRFMATASTFVTGSTSSITAARWTYSSRAARQARCTTSAGATRYAILTSRAKFSRSWTARKP